MKPHSPDAAGIRAMWDVLRGAAVPERLPAGISALAARHNCGAALFSTLDHAGLREAVDYTDWCLLRGLAFFHRARARRFQEILQQLAAEAPQGAPWFVWKGAALLTLLSGYEERFEAGDIDIAVQQGALEPWAEHLALRGAVVTRRNVTAAGLQGFQARFPESSDAVQPAIVLDVKGEARMPALQFVAGVPVPVKERHLEWMRQHADKHAGLPAPKLRLVYDAYLFGSQWHDEVFRLLFPDAASIVETNMKPPAQPEEGAMTPAADVATRQIRGDGCVILLDTERSFHFDRDAVEKSLPRLLAASRPSAAVRLDVRVDRDARPYAIEERSDRTVLWIRKPPSAPECKRLIAAMVQRAYQSIGLLTLHCTVVARGNRAIAFLGSFGSGKTLTSIRLCNAGAALLAGDAALVAGGFTIAGGTREAWLDRTVRDRYFPHLPDRGEEGASALAPRVDVATGVPWVSLASPPPALAALVFVTVTPVQAADSFAVPMPVDTAALNLFRASSYRFDTVLPSCGLPLTELEPRAQRQWRVDQCRALAESVSAFRVGGSLEYATDVALRLLV